ncbi:MAG: type II toxin-antitoxin system RelE/ParE family toxin [Chthoniobacterales bacterium]|nr:type II toxin-antitoxin system RelE/ParE family toxin [Chthoniobacterales bacterium]
MGGDFIRSVDACFALLAEQPGIYPVVHREARLGLIKRFPYLVIYRVFPNFISVVAVMHGQRHPRRWQARLEN